MSKIVSRGDGYTNSVSPSSSSVPIASIRILPNEGDVILTAAKITTIEAMMGITTLNPYVITVATDSRVDKTMPSTLNGDMEGKELAFNGAVWSQLGTFKGVDGTPATISIGSVTKVDAGGTPTVVNSGTASASIFDFGLVTGDKGDTGSIINNTGAIFTNPIIVDTPNTITPSSVTDYDNTVDTDDTSSWVLTEQGTVNTQTISFDTTSKITGTNSYRLNLDAGGEFFPGSCTFTSPVFTIPGGPSVISYKFLTESAANYSNLTVSLKSTSKMISIGLPAPVAATTTVQSLSGSGFLPSSDDYVIEILYSYDSNNTDVNYFDDFKVVSNSATIDFDKAIHILNCTENTCIASTNKTSGKRTKLIVNNNTNLENLIGFRLGGDSFGVRELPLLAPSTNYTYDIYFDGTENIITPSPSYDGDLVSITYNSTDTDVDETINVYPETRVVRLNMTENGDATPKWFLDYLYDGQAIDLIISLGRFATTAITDIDIRYRTTPGSLSQAISINDTTSFAIAKDETWHIRIAVLGGSSYGAGILVNS